ncbi:MAG: polymer-forming cytoskeletal protein [Deltaproteobacteria bacterium]|nr:polymer-forming cytoskeletal protein [Deltaproteobacteria bacterium]
MADAPCVIGRGITIKGNLSGAEQLVIEGAVEGHISLKNHLTIKETGRITADITTHSLMVHGQVSGNIEANDLVSLSAEASVVADIKAPRVVLEDGARFKGRIEMDVQLPPGV